MLKKAGVLLLWVLLLACIVLLLWGLALYKSWPLWYVPLICIVTLLVVFLPARGRATLVCLALASPDEQRVAPESSR